jgi:uncharacterized membrane protein YeaQ/YmgE (transglycosylase-associated protein family)
MAVEFLLLIIVVCIVAGLIVRGLILGRKELSNPAAIISTALCGILGAFLTTWIGQAIGWYRPEDQGAVFIAAIIGAVLAG